MDSAERTLAMEAQYQRLIRFEGMVHGWLVRHSITALRISLGAIFLGFGILKYFPGVSPAANIAETTIGIMTFHIITGEPALVITATLECVIGLSLITGRGLRVVVYLLVLELLGILSPIVLLTGRLFAGPYHAPTLEGQYVLKDIILVAASMVIATRFRGARISYDGSQVTPALVPSDPADLPVARPQPTLNSPRTTDEDGGSPVVHGASANTRREGWTAVQNSTVAKQPT